MLPFGMISGVKASSTPKFLKLIVTAANPCPGCTTGEGKLSAGQHLGFLAIHGDHARLGQDLQKIPLLQGLDHRAKVDVAAEEKQIEEVAS